MCVCIFFLFMRSSYIHNLSHILHAAVVCVCSVHTVMWSFQRKRNLETEPQLVALQQHSVGQLEGKKSRKWDFGDLGHERQKRNGVGEEVRKFLMT